MAARGDEVQVAADAGFCGMDVAQVVRAVDDPEFLVAGGEIEDLLILGENDQGREAQLRANRNDVLLGILDDTRRFGGGAHGAMRKRRNQDHHGHRTCQDRLPTS